MTLHKTLRNMGCMLALLGASAAAMAAPPVSNPSEAKLRAQQKAIDAKLAAAHARNDALQAQVAQMEQQNAAQQKRLQQRNAEIAALQEKLRAAGAATSAASAGH